MISLFEAAELDVDLPISPLPLGSSRQAPTVQPLEFEKIDHPLRRRTDRMDDEGKLEPTENPLKKECARLEERLRVLTVDVAQQVGTASNEAKSEARLEWKEELREGIAAERAQVVKTCTEFEKVRTSYFAAVEAEVVRLALAIAARVLHREAKLDPLLLGAVVRVALEKVADESGTILHVPLQQVESWRVLLAEAGQSAVAVVGEEQMATSDCVLATSVGRVELGVVAQLDEIEKGFFDLMQQRPI